MFPWLWYRLAAVALIPPLAWELPYALSVALKSQKKNKNKKEVQDIAVRRGAGGAGAGSLDGRHNVGQSRICKYRDNGHAGLAGSLPHPQHLAWAGTHGTQQKCILLNSEWFSLAGAQGTY